MDSDPFVPNPPLTPRTVLNYKAAHLAQIRTFHLHALVLYNRDAHTRYLRMNEEKIAWDIARRCFVEGVFRDPFSDMEDHALEIVALFARVGVWEMSESVRGLVRRWREGGGGGIGHGEWEWCVDDLRCGSQGGNKNGGS